MEFPDLGQSCSLADCKRLDFIPLKCLCQDFFCKDHFTSHCLSGACSYYNSLEKKVSLTADSPLYRCTTEKCSVTSYIELPCPKCRKHYCVSHRFHPECPEIDPEVLAAEKKRWEAPKQQFELARAAVEAQVITKNLRLFQSSDSNSKTALKVLIMKLKTLAKGDSSIPLVDRIYFGFKKPVGYFPKPLSEVPNEDVLVINAEKQMNEIKFASFVSRNWTLGRAIDSISNLHSIKNENNDPKAPKLRVFRYSDGFGVFNEIPKKLTEILEAETLINGDRLVLEYVSCDGLDPNKTYFLQDV